ncbi:VOC family protein [Agromyces sp. H3Y2-19a]|jgi:catechol 2,3-dioxygenase-like lactoylglutathione lyase family enzyme|uniref:VOC family protein n=1 Tax=Agromyces TaxID=33877 RepID=UPI001E4869DD|nr:MULTISPECIES: VOC family protein [Agromyces]MCD5346593.1 VOC family protein [Agromyces sp. S2-1-8]MDF0512953.1 VOC family protein [Agromyces chromiiresistens]
MVQMLDAFPGLAVDDIDAARNFYRDVIGLDVADDMGGLRLTLPSGQTLFVYGKPDHEPAGFTVLNFVVADVDAAADELNAAGVVTKIYAGDLDYGTDERGIAHGREAGTGPDICWFRDPAGNVLSVLQP